MDALIRELRKRAADPARRTTVPRRAKPLSAPEPAALASAVRDLAVLLAEHVALNRAGTPPHDPLDLGGLVVDPVRPAEVSPLPGPVDDAGLDHAARSLGQDLPEFVRRMYRDVADGGFGPGEGLLSLDEVVAAYRERREATDLPIGATWPPSLVPLVAADPGWHCIDTTTGAIVAWDPEGLTERATRTAFTASFTQVAQSVEHWLEEWLARPTLAEEAQGVGGSLVTMRFGQAQFMAMLGPSMAVPSAGGVDQSSTRAIARARPRGGEPPMTTSASHGGGLIPDARAAARFLGKVAARIVDDTAGAVLDDRLSRAQVDLTPAQRAQVAQVRDRISAARLAWHVPRKSTGAPDGAAALALAPLGSPDRRPGTREAWLVARCVDMLGSTGFALTVEELISENESHRWHEETWRWAADDRSPLPVRWGATLEDVRSTLDAEADGRWPEAFATWAVDLDDALVRLLAGDDADPSLADLTAAWQPRLASTMARLAPWRLSQATGALRRGRPMRLFGLGGVTQQRKPGVFLSGDAHRPRLTIEWSASNERVSEAAWVRPLDLDLVHAGLIKPGSIPGLP